MQCPSCDAENRDAARECSSCGAPLGRRCATCDTPAPLGARFCAACGRELAEHSEGQKRQITVLFADLDESTPLAHRLDLEDLQRLVRNFQDLCASEIERYGGRVVQHLGDGVLAYFGQPSAHEDDAARAIRAALGILDGARRIATGDETAPLSARAGVHTGLVVVGDIGSGAHRETLAVGKTVNVASRVLGVAGPGEVLITGATQRLAGHGIEAEALGERALRGVAGPVLLYRVRGLGGADARTAPWSAFVGRERELSRLEEALASLARGRGAMLAISGEAGIGKTRLLSEFRKRVERARGDWIEWRCSRFMERTAFQPVASALERRLEQRLASAEDRESPEARALAALTRLQSGDLGTAEGAAVTPEARRVQTIAALTDWVTDRCGSTPVVLAVEDAQWADPSTLELLSLLRARCPDLPLLVVATHRPELPLAALGDGTEVLALTALAERESRQLLGAILGERTPDEEVCDALVARSDGVPLFVEEMARVLLESGTALASTTLPMTLRSLLDSRLDKVPSALIGTLHLASVLGREFRLAQLAAVGAQPESALLPHLEALAAASLLVRDPSRADVFSFRHVLVQEAVYESMLRAERSRLHLRVASTLESAHPAIASEQPELLAHHYTEAGRLEQAVGYWRRAGERATARGAYRESIGLFDRGLALIGRQPASSDRLLTELALVQSKGTALFSTFGYADPRVEESFERAWALCEKLGSGVPQRVLYGLWAVHLSRSDREQVDALLARMRAWQGTGDAVGELTAHGCAGLRAFLTGDFARCRDEMREGISWFDSPAYQDFIEESGYEGSLYLFAYRMWGAWILGDIDLASRYSEELEALASRARTPYGPCIARGFIINLLRDRGDVARARALAEEQLAHTTKQLIYLWQGPAHCGLGWALAREGEVTAGIAEIRAGLAIMQTIGLTTTLPYYQSALVEALLAQGDAKAALESARQALGICERSLDRFYEAELRRLEGEALHALCDEDAARRALEAALALSRKQGARSYELRAALSLARQWADVGDPRAAREVLAPIHAQFREGFETADLRAARAMLERLA